MCVCVFERVIPDDDVDDLILIEPRWRAGLVAMVSVS